MSLSVENKSLPPIANILSIKTQTFNELNYFFHRYLRFFFLKQDICDDKHQQKTCILWPLCVPRNVTSGN